MAQGQLETTLADLARVRDDFDDRREVLDRASFTLLHQPALGGQLIARFCATDEDAAELEHLTELLGSALDAARLARESQKKRGDVFLAGIADAVDLAAGQGRLQSFHRLLLASVWARTGLAAPGALELSAADMELANERYALPDDDAAEEMLHSLFRDLIEQSGGDAFVLQAALSETFPAMPAEMREHVIAWSVARPEPIHAKLACFWLLDPSAPIRLSAARALAARATSGALSADIAGTLVMLRSWMPDDGARGAVDQALKLAMQAGLGARAKDKPWTIHNAVVTLPDGGGAQSILISLQSGGSRKTALLLLKQGYGIKDAYTVPCNSATEQKELVQRITEETGAVRVPMSWIERLLSMALADGLAASLPPAPGLIDVADICGLTALRPEPVTTEALTLALPAASRIRGLSAQARGKLINASRDWWDRHVIVQSWFDESDHVQELMEGTRSPRALESALWKWLETRRDYWARLIALGADALAAGDHSDAESFTATAIALLDGRDLKKIPVMIDVHEQTIESWIFDDPNIEQNETLPEFVEQAVEPEPESKGELARLVKGSSISADWIDGFLMSITLAPKLISPNKWLPEILGTAIANLVPASFQRFVDLIMMRANTCVEQASQPAQFTGVMSKRSKMAMRDWAAGFSYACGQFRSSWPAKSTGPDDRAMMQSVSDAMATGFSAAELKTLSQWVAARDARNNGA